MNNEENSSIGPQKMRDENLFNLNTQRFEFLSSKTHDTSYYPHTVTTTPTHQKLLPQTLSNLDNERQNYTNITNFSTKLPISNSQLVCTTSSSQYPGLNPVSQISQTRTINHNSTNNNKDGNFSRLLDNPYPKFWGRSRREHIQLSRALPRGLDLYQIVAPPRVLDDDLILESKHDLTSSELRSDLTCTICMGILQGTMVIKNCLHRFCGDCIEKCVRIGIRECPQCRNHVPSRRALRKDPIFDQIVQRLFRNVKDFEDKNEHLLVEANKRLSLRSDEDPFSLENETNPSRSVSPSPPSISPLVHRGVYITTNGLNQHRNSQNTLINTEYLLSDSKLSKVEKRRKRREVINQLKKIPFDGLLHFELLPDPEISNLPELNKNKLNTTGILSILQLSRYITKMLNLNKEHPIKFYTKNHRSAFQPNSSLAHVHHQSFAFSNEIVVLYYTTRNYVDPHGGIPKGNRGYVAPIQNSLSVLSNLTHESTKKST